MIKTQELVLTIAISGSIKLACADLVGFVQFRQRAHQHLMRFPSNRLISGWG